MKTTGTTLGVIAGCLLFAAQVPAQDWTQWRGSTRDSKVVGFKVPETWPKELKKLWKSEVGLGEASPALVGDRVYAFGRVGAQETVSCLDAATGKVLWQQKYDAPTVTGGPGQHPGPRSSPAVADGKVVTLGVGGMLTCWNTEDGTIAWKNDSKIWPQFYTGTSPMVVDGMAIVHLGNDASGTIMGYDLKTGAEKWKWTGDGPSYGSAVLMTAAGTRQLVELTQKQLVGVSVSDGKLLWQMPFAVQSGAKGTPVVDGDTVYVFGKGKGSMAVKVEKTGDTFAPKTLWTKTQPNTDYTTPVFKDGYLYGANSVGNLFCMDAKTGDVVWTDNVRRGDPAEILDVGPVLLAVTTNSEMAVIQPSDDNKSFKELAKIKLADTPIWSYPIVSGNRIFVKDKDSVILWSME